jgi:nucleoside-diphosphate-sugar epimerase
LTVYGDGSQRRDFTFVDDAVRAFLLAAARDEAAGQVYNLGSHEVISLRELADLLVEVNGSGTIELIPFPADRRAIDIGDYYADYSKIEQELGWVPTVGLGDGIARSLEYYRERGSAYWSDE